ncbi:MAG: hypothetical protein NC930_06065 [Candidatus Omnitrophica bacterium]|nr:hypothetical protein [Candidatus Omnitrophota bacterium]
MSTIYKHLSKDDLKLERTSPALIAPEITGPPRLIGVKIAILFAFLLSLAAFAGSLYLYFALNAERKERTALEASQIQFRERTQSLELESDQYRSEIGRMRDQVKTIAGERNDLKKQLDQSWIEISNLNKMIKNLEDRSAKLEAQARGVQTPATPVAVPPTVAQTAVPVVSQKTPTTAAKETPAAAVPAPTAPVKRPQIMTVNRKFNFVVVNVGLRDQLKIGDFLVAERDGKPIGRVQVEKLYDNFAAATIVEENENSKIAEGDSIRKV